VVADNSHTCSFTLAALRTNVTSVLLFFGLVMFFSLECAAFNNAGNRNTTMALYYQKAAGGFGIFTSICAGWLTMHLTFASTNLPVPVPIGDLSNVSIFSRSKRSSESAEESKDV